VVAVDFFVMLLHSEKFMIILKPNNKNIVEHHMGDTYFFTPLSNSPIADIINDKDNYPIFISNETAKSCIESVKNFDATNASGF